MKSIRRVRFEPKENGIHVANLPPTVTTDFIKSLFSESGQVINVVLKQKPTSCFAFVDFALREEAEAAVRDFNYTKLNGESIIVTRTTSEIVNAIQSGQGNLFIKGLDPSIDCLQLHELFSNYGEIVSVRIPTLNGVPRGFAYVQFLNQADAERAQKELSDSTVNGNPIQIGPFLKRSERPANAALTANMDSTFTNVFVKNLPESINTLLSLLKLFSEFGDVVSARIVPERRIGYVMMSTHDAAVRAVVGLCGRTIFGSRISCCRSLSAAERANFVKKVIDGENTQPATQQSQQRKLEQEYFQKQMEQQKSRKTQQNTIQDFDSSNSNSQPTFHPQDQIDQNAASVFQAQSTFGQPNERKFNPNVMQPENLQTQMPTNQQMPSYEHVEAPQQGAPSTFTVQQPGQLTKLQPVRETPPNEQQPQQGQAKTDISSATPNGSEPEPEPASESQSEHDPDILPPPVPTNPSEPVVQDRRQKQEFISSSEDDRPKASPSNPFG